MVARSSRDPFLSPFVGAARLHGCAFLAAPDISPRLAYFSPMERGEAERSGLDLLTPERLDVERWARRHGPDSPEFLADTLSRALHLSEIAPGEVALAGHLDLGVGRLALGRLEAEGWSFTRGDRLVQAFRRFKSTDQLDEMRRVAEGTRSAFARVAELLAAAADLAPGAGDALQVEGAPLRVGRLRAEIARKLAEHGLEQPEGNLVAPGEEGAMPHSTGTDERVLRAGESLVVDLFPTDRLYIDCTRTFCVGEAPEALRRGHAEVVAALDAARALARPGCRGWDLQKLVCDRLKAAGYPTPIHDRGTLRGYVHGLGHGLGFEVHEAPSFREEATDEEGTLAEGDTFTLEPGLYEPDDGWAVRVEDTCALAGGDLETLTAWPTALDPRAWREFASGDGGG